MFLKQNIIIVQYLKFYQHLGAFINIPLNFKFVNCNYNINSNIKGNMKYK